MKKILYVITKSNWGGAQKQVFELATRVSDEFDVYVAMGGTGGSGSACGTLYEKLRHAGMEKEHFFHLKFLARDLGIISDLCAFFELFFLFWNESPDIVHLHSSKMAAYGAIAARLAGIPTIITTIHGWAFKEDRSLFFKALFYLAHLLGGLASHTVVTINKADEVVGKSMPFLKKKVTRIYNGLPGHTLPPRDVARKEVHARLGIPLDSSLIGSVGELTKNKGYRYALEAMALLKKKNVAFTYLIMGEGEERELLQTLSQKLTLREHVVFAGFVHDAAHYLPALDVLFLPSIKEGLPSVLLEAGGAATATLATDIPGSSDIIENDVSGVLVPSRDSNAMSEALHSLLHDKAKRERLGKALRLRVLKEFSLSSMLRELKELYR